MEKCKRIKALIKLIPIRSLQYSLLQSHLLKCDVCQKDLATIDEARSATVQKDRIGSEKDFWPQLVRDLKKEKQKKVISLHTGWRWALGIAGAVALTFALIFVMTKSPQQENPYTSVKLIIDYVKIYDEPAQGIIFQTQDSNRTFVWVEKQSKGEMP